MPGNSPSMLGARGVRSPILWEVDFTDPALLTTSPATITAARAFLTSKGIAFTRASAATAQTSASSLYTGFGVDDPRVGDGGYGQGLVLEESRTNLIPDSRNDGAASWAGGSLLTRTRPYATSPDGSTTTDTRSQVSSGGYSNYRLQAVTSGAKYAFSSWQRHATANGAAALFFGTSTVAGAVVTRSIGTTYERLVGVRTTSSAGENFAPADGRDLTGIAGGPAAGARDIVADLHQVELGGFSTEAIVTTGASATRAADILRLASATRVVRNGRVRAEFQFVPKGGSGDYATDRFLWNYASGGINALYWAADGTGRIVAYSKGVPVVSTNGVTFAAGDVVRVYVEHGNGACYGAYSINGGARTVITFPATSLAALDSAAVAMDLMSGLGSYFTAWLQRVVFYATRPSWVA